MLLFLDLLNPGHKAVILSLPHSPRENHLERSIELKSQPIEPRLQLSIRIPGSGTDKKWQ